MLWIASVYLPIWRRLFGVSGIHQEATRRPAPEHLCFQEKCWNEYQRGLAKPQESAKLYHFQTWTEERKWPRGTIRSRLRCAGNSSSNPWCFSESLAGDTVEQKHKPVLCRLLEKVIQTGINTNNNLSVSCRWWMQSGTKSRKIGT